MYIEPVTTCGQKSVELHIFLAYYIHFLHKNSTIEGQTRAFSRHSLLQPISFKRSLDVTRSFFINFAVGDSNIAFKNRLVCLFLLTLWAKGFKIYTACQKMILDRFFCVDLVYHRPLSLLYSNYLHSMITN